MKKKVLLVLVLVFFLLLIILDFYKFKSLQIKKKNYSFFNQIEEKLINIKTNDININDVIPFQWNEIYIVDSYTPNKQIFDIIGTKYTTATNYFKYKLFGNYTGIDDDYKSKVIFLNDKKVVHEEIYDNNRFKFNNCYYNSNKVAAITIEKNANMNLLILH